LSHFSFFQIFKVGQNSTSFSLKTVLSSPPGFIP
jgi:hypothetical protein